MYRPLSLRADARLFLNVRLRTASDKWLITDRGSVVSSAMTNRGGVVGDGPKRVFLVSPPRSGHHMLVGWLDKSFGPNLDYCELYSCTDSMGRYRRCEAQGWRSDFKVVCRSGCRFQKNHDFDLSLPRMDYFQYVALVRNPMFSLSSWWVLEGQKVGRCIREYMLSKVPYWKEFAAKWVLPGATPNIFVTRYEDLISEPEVMRSMADFLNPGLRPISAHCYDRAFLQRNVLPQRQLRSEPHFDLPTFVEVEQAIGTDLLARLGYERMFS